MDSVPNKQKRDLFSLFLLAFSLLFYLFFAFYDGVVICVDSPTYISMELAREPFYSLFLAALRGIFDDGDFYLQVAVFLQSLLAALSAWSMARFLQKTFRLPRFMAFALLCIPLAVSLLCRFAAGRASMYSNSIMTEGICISLWLLLFRYLLEYCFTGSRKSLWIGFLLCVIMISTRKQMLATLPLLGLVLFFAGLYRSRRLDSRAAARGCSQSGAETEVQTFSGTGAATQTFSDSRPAACGLLRAISFNLGKALLLCVLVLLCTSLFDRCYNLALRGEFVRHSSDNRFLATMVFYTATQEDASYIKDPETRQLFLDIYDTCEAGGFLGHSAGEGWLNRVGHFGDHYDHIQIDTLWPMVRAYAEKQLTAAGSVTAQATVRDFYTDALMREMTGALLPHTFPRILAVLFDNLLSGLVTTVAQRVPILIFYTVGIYLAYLVLMALVWKRGGDRRILALAALTLAGILINVTVVSAVIFCQTRYTIYNMPLFYMSGLLLLWEACRLLKPKK